VTLTGGRPGEPPGRSAATEAEVVGNCPMTPVLSMEALAAIFVPSKATGPTPVMPAAAHSRSDPVNSVLSACS
jgi:hypothetical protein